MRYTQEELEFLQKNYPKHGRKYCSKKLNRSQDAIWEKAKKMGLKVGDLPELTPLTEIAKFSGLSYQVIWYQAKRDKVITYLGKGIRKKPCATMQWVDDIIPQLIEQRINQDKCSHWLNTTQTIEILKVGKGSMIRAASESKGWLVPYLKHLKIKKGTGGKFLFEPNSVQNLSLILEKERQKTRSLEFAKSHWLEQSTGKSRSTSLHHLKKTRKTKRVLRNGRWQIMYEQNPQN